MCYIGTVMPQIFIASEDTNFLSITQYCFFVRVYMGRDGLYRMREVSFGISFSREGSLVPGKEIVKPLFCSIHTASGQGLLYFLDIEKLLIESCIKAFVIIGSALDFSPFHTQHLKQEYLFWQ